MQILAAVDGTRFSIDVLTTANRIARLLSLDVDAVNVHADDSAAAAGMAEQAGVAFRLLFGDPATAILRALEDDEARLAVLGAGRSRPVGPVAGRVLAQSTKGVVVVPQPTLPLLAGEATKVVVPLDGEGTTTAALTRQLRAFADHGAAVIGLHVFTAEDGPVYWDHFHHDYLAWQARFLRQSCPAPTARLQVAYGPVAAATVDLAIRERATLIAVAWSQDLSPGHAGIVTDLLASSPIPLLLVPSATRLRPAGVLVAGSA